MKDRLTGKVVLVTGCGSSGPGWGNGKAISILCAQEQASVFGCDINPRAAKATEKLILDAGGLCEVASTDVGEASQVEVMVNRCLARFGRIDVLVNNVGVVRVGGPIECTLEDWQRDIQINITSMFLTCKYVLPHMERQGGGSIINMGSVASIRYTGVSYISYYTTKAAVLGFSRAIAMQYAHKHIRSNVVLPGLMNTPMILGPLKETYGDIERMIEARNKQCPMGHMGDAWDVAEAVVYLASDQAKYVTGTELLVDGGISARFAS
jgi:NAD(P)-dependent dehydrogenase (short-subunit alcohol dehydrogenase family)